MRLSFSEAFRGKLRDYDKDDLAMLYDVGIRVGGISCAATETDDDVKYASDLLHGMGFELGTFWCSGAAYHPDPVQHRNNRKTMRRQIEIAGMLGCTTCGFSVGSLSPDGSYNVYPENVTQRALDIFIDHTKELIPFAENAGVVISPETTKWTVVNGIERMKEFVERIDSPAVRISFDPVNHMTADRLYESGTYIRQAISYLGDCIGSIHCKDIQITSPGLVVHLDECLIGDGVLEHVPLLEMSRTLEPWKTFTVEHVWERPWVKPTFTRLQQIADSIGHTWTDPHLTRLKWLAGERG